MSQPSLRRSLLVRCGLGIGALLLLLSAAVYLIVSRSLYRELDGAIMRSASLLANQVELEHDKLIYEWREGLGSNRALAEDDFFQFWDLRTGGTSRSPGLRSKDLPAFTGIDGQPLLRNILLPNGHRGRAVGMRIFPFVLPEEIEAMKGRERVINPLSLPLTLVVSRDMEPLHRTLGALQLVLGCGSVLTLLMGFAIVGRVVRTTLGPIDKLTAQLKDRAEHQLDLALELPGKLPEELVGLAENFDNLLGRVAAIRVRERDFIRHAAHELRTPIAGLRATTDLALSQPRDAAAYAAHLASCQRTAIELGELVKRLSALSRIGQSGAPPHYEPVDIGATLAECVQIFLSRFEERGLVIRRGLPADVMIVTGSITLVRIILNNLLDNAACYAVPGSEILIRGQTYADRVEISIDNRAQDLPPNLERLFEPLFRKEPSRNDAETHLGIGLTLAQEAATAMGAKLRAMKPEEGWIGFTLTMDR